MSEEPFFSREMHDNHVKALAAVTRERDDAKGEIARLRTALTTALLYIEFEPIRAELQAVLDKEVR